MLLLLGFKTNIIFLLGMWICQSCWELQAVALMQSWSAKVTSALKSFNYVFLLYFTMQTQKTALPQPFGWSWQLCWTETNLFWKHCQFIRKDELSQRWRMGVSLLHALIRPPWMTKKTGLNLNIHLLQKCVFCLLKDKNTEFSSL